MRLAIVQNLPLEFYPPVTNLLRYLAARPEFEVRVFSVGNLKGRPEWSHPNIGVSRCSPPDPGHGAVRRLLHSLLFVSATLVGLIRFRPDAVLYFEPHSALPIFLYRRFFARDLRVFVHHHEYYEPGQFSGAGMRLPRLAHACEKRWLFEAAEWISQTNPDRIRLFLADHPRVDPAKLRPLPNYPPRVWRDTENRAWKTGCEPFRCVYVGSVSLQDTFIEPLVDWLESTRWPVTLDLYAYNVPPETAHWLERRSGDRLRFHSEGVPYDDLPTVLSGYHAGLILYRGNTANFVWNAPNKLFEYLACGLDVWYPPTMEGIRPYRDEAHAPRIAEVDFEALDRAPIGELLRRDVLPDRDDAHFAETVYSDLVSELLRNPGNPK